MFPILVAERVTRDMRGKLGLLQLAATSAKDLADSGRGVVIGNCAPHRTVAKIAGSIRNLLHPHRCIVACHSYELARDIVEKCRTLGTVASLLDCNERLTTGHLQGSAIVTVPEQLYQCREAVRSGAFQPLLLYLVDLNGLTLSARYEEQGLANRAAGLSQFRGFCLAQGCQTLPVLWISCSPIALFPETVCTAFGVEATISLDGATLRTAFAPDDAQPCTGYMDDVYAASTEQTHPLDGQVTQARQQRSRLMLHLSAEYCWSAQTLRQLADLRGYPQVSLKPFWKDKAWQLSMQSEGHRHLLREIAEQLTCEVRRVNKQVVILTDSDIFYRNVGPCSALFALASAKSGSLLIASGPRGLSKRDVEHLFRDIRRIDPDVSPPSLMDA